MPLNGKSLTPTIADYAKLYHQRIPVCGIYLQICMRKDSPCVVRFLLKVIEIKDKRLNLTDYSYRKSNDDIGLTTNPQQQDDLDWPESVLL